jgi:hypothetical protein
LRQSNAEEEHLQEQQIGWMTLPHSIIILRRRHPNIESEEAEN